MGGSLSLDGKHVLITGGSTGIGFYLAVEAVKLKANVTILARTPSKLEDAKAKLVELSQLLGSGSKVSIQAADVTDPKQVTAAIEAAEIAQGPIELLISNAGAATPGYFHEQDVSIFEQMMKLNYLGTVNTLHAVYPRMVARNSGRICIVSSTMGTMGFVGYSAYAPSKYALKGLADCLRNELQGTNVTICLAYPPDTDTPGYETETATKPEETKQISALSSVFKPEKVSEILMKGIRRGSYGLPTPDLGLQVHNIATKGLLPRSFPGVLLDMLLGFIGPIIHWVYVSILDGISRKGAQQRFANLWGPSDNTGRQ